jgi:hypothetical protein
MSATSALNWHGDMWFKIALLCCAFPLFALVEQMERPFVDKMKDLGFISFQWANDFCQTHATFTDALLLAETLFLLVCVSITFYYLYTGPSLRVAYALFAHFAARAVCMYVVVLPVPAGMIWRAPGRFNHARFSFC